MGIRLRQVRYDGKNDGHKREPRRWVIEVVGPSPLCRLLPATSLGLELQELASLRQLMGLGRHSHWWLGAGRMLAKQHRQVLVHTVRLRRRKSSWERVPSTRCHHSWLLHLAHGR